MLNHDQSWSIVIFGYNEVGAIAQTLSDTIDTAKTLAGNADWEVIVVDDGSTDGTAETAQQVASDIPGVRVIRHPRNRGIGHALYSGYEASRFENIVAVPADGQFDTKELLAHRHVPADEFVVFTREKQTGYSLFRLLLSRANRWLNSLLLGLNIQDVNWVKIYKGSELSRLALETRSNLIESEIVAKLLVRGNKPMEVPSIYHRRTSGVSKATSLRYLQKTAKEFWHLLIAVTKYRSAYDRSNEHSFKRG